MRDLGKIQAVKVDMGGQSHLLRTDLEGVAHKAFLAAGVRPPSSVTSLG